MNSRNRRRRHAPELFAHSGYEPGDPHRSSADVRDQMAE